MTTQKHRFFVHADASSLSVLDPGGQILIHVEGSATAIGVEYHPGGAEAVLAAAGFTEDPDRALSNAERLTVDRLLEAATEALEEALDLGPNQEETFDEDD